MRLRNARLLDLDTGAASDPQDIWVQGNRISRRPIEDERQVIDLHGRIVMPGLWDVHVHAGQWALASHRLDLSGCESAAECVELTRQSLVHHAPDSPLIGVGYRDGMWQQQPSARLLDEVSEITPIALISGDLHAAWANTAALERFGFGGHPSGHLVETEAFELQTAVNKLPDLVLDEWVHGVLQAATRRGLVGVVDIERANNAVDWRRRFASERPPPTRIRASIWPEWLDAAIAEGLHTGMLLDDTGLLSVGPLKIITDGSMTARTAWCRDEYVDPLQGHPHGMAWMAPEELESVLYRARSAGLDCAVHAIGDAACAMVLAAFAETGARGTIEHAQFMRPGDIAEMAQLDITASVQPAQMLDDRDTVDALWPGLSQHVFPLASMAAAGITLAFGSDAPCAPANPWLAIELSVTRITDAERGSWHPDERLTLSKALLCSTNGVRALVPGARADLIALDENPFEVEPERLRTFRAWLTMVDGRVVHSWEE